MVPITSLDDPRVLEYRFLPERSGRLHSGQYTIVESELVVQRLLTHDWCKGKIVSALLEPEAAERLRESLIGRGVDPERIYVASKSLMEGIVGYQLHRGVFVCLEVPHPPILEELSLPAVLLVSVSSATNVGAIARTAAAFGIRSLICDSRSASPWLRRSIRVSMGAVFHLSLYHATVPAEDLIVSLRKRGARLIGAEVGANESYWSFSWSAKDVIIFGSEGQGLTREFLAQLDAGVHVPINPVVDSLNVAAAAAVILAEYARHCDLAP